MLNSRRHPEPIKNIDCVLLGAFERHNFGDLLMGYIFETLLGRPWKTQAICGTMAL
jgi:hypothetical protein